MASLFKRKVAKTPTINEDGPSGASIKSRKVKKGSASPSISSGNSPSSKLHLDDWGRQLSVAPPAFSSTSSNGGAARPSANGEFGSGYGIGDDSDVRELVLMYGYSPVATTLELSPDSVVEIVVACAGEILQRGAWAATPGRSPGTRARRWHGADSSLGNGMQASIHLSYSRR